MCCFFIYLMEKGSLAPGNPKNIVSELHDINYLKIVRSERNEGYWCRHKKGEGKPGRYI